LKGLLLLLCVAAVLGVTACGGNSTSNEPSGPLGLEQRTPNESDAPGSHPDPVEKTETASTPFEFVQRMGDQFVNPTKQERKEFLTLGFVQAIRDTRFFPSEPGAEHSKGDAHLFDMTLQFKTDAAAKRMAQVFNIDSQRPCPHSCATSVALFKVDGIPGAYGVRRYATEADIQAAGTSQDHPYDSYEIYFADGVFAYRVDLSGPPGTTSEDKAKEIAQNFYDRVAGRPAAS
jgi:hypothetical protein